MKRLLILVLVAVTLSPGIVFASVVYDNGTYVVTQSGNDATGWVQADDFTLSSGGTIGGAGIYIGTLMSGANQLSYWDNTLQYYIFSDNAGKPGTVLASGSGQNITTTDTGNLWQQAAQYGSASNVWLFGFNFQNSFTAQAGTKYWFGVHLTSDYILNDPYQSDCIFWLQNTTNGNAHETYSQTLDNWTLSPGPSGSGGERAYYLTTPVPIPGTLVLLFSGLCLMHFLKRRK